MKNVETPQYCRYTITDAICRLEGLRSTVGWGQLNEDLEVAINCMQYAADVMKAEEDAVFETIDFGKLNKEIDDILENQSQGKG